MKVSLLLLALVLVCLVQGSESWRLRRTLRRIGRGIRRVGRVVKNVACNHACPRLCRQGVCKLACNLGCRGKRDVTQQLNQQGHVTPIPNSFAAYDMNEDGIISRKELALAIGEDIAHPDFMKAYSIADVDGDGELSPKEFYNGPYVFEMDLNDDDLAYCRYRLDIDDDLIDVIEGELVNQAPNFIEGNQVKETGKPHEIISKTGQPETKPIDKYVKLAEKTKTQ
ncbi:hypothetical protein LOTGIDRAFT_230492 [Lottia gigantea]|uniref:EF-hand calcium-binding domain-containing protein 1 n=2 Tax=Lottia gigantea TaxID=225164 RepID=EFCB1_LOTGI|nr:hypothetical protein LOTGIDRAFT_230492 [Lottia gigantea]B3A0Q5.1 RecName: Full=EF-hand calcium-binding domain-containing protein 1; Flags: Precursor [Lottia gigantea]ESP03069.1 hypothetical protein LOTGIDRAFT_230492 [Lottia gigantea]